MNVQQADDLIAALQKQAAAQIIQAEAISRLAESNEALCNLIIQSLADELEDTSPVKTYLSGKPVRGE